jgi:hypothetical protein
MKSKKATTKKTTAKKSGKKRTISAKAKKAGSEVMAMAKKIRKASPGKKWPACVKAAGVEYRKKH